MSQARRTPGAEQQGSEDLIANTRIGLCINHFFAGHLRESLQEADEILKKMSVLLAETEAFTVQVHDMIDDVLD